jgi:hypothetical protein
VTTAHHPLLRRAWTGSRYSLPCHCAAWVFFPPPPPSLSLSLSPRCCRHIPPPPTKNAHTIHACSPFITQAQITVVQHLDVVGPLEAVSTDEVHSSLLVACVGGVGALATLDPAAAASDPMCRGLHQLRDIIGGLQRQQVCLGCWFPSLYQCLLSARSVMRGS